MCAAPTCISSKANLPRAAQQVIPGHQIVGEVVEAQRRLPRHARGRFLDRRHGRHLLVLPQQAWRTFATRPPSPATAWTAATRNMRWPAPISFFRCRRRSTIWMPRRCCAPASSASAAFAWPASNPASAWACSDSALRRTWPSQVLHAWKCEVYVSTRGASHRRLADSLGADWVGAETDRPPVELDRAITFAPSGDVVVAALASLRKGGVVAINAIHLDRMPQFDYDRLLWGERQIRSVANMTRADARDFLQLAADIKLRPKVTSFPLDQANEALPAVKSDAIDGAAVIVP